MGCKISKGDFFFLSRVLFSFLFLFLFFFCFFFCFCFMNLKLTPSSFLYFLFSCRIARGHKEVSTSQAGRMRGTLGKRLLQAM